tara:strand:- start:46278 stop:46946 length:669 start_codon:yes stop_codon:yes gene_type:complete
MSTILAIETATPVCSIAIRSGNGVISEKKIKGSGVHSANTFLFIQELMEEYANQTGDLDFVLFSHGPGSYTGLRIGASAIKGLLFNQKIPLYSLSSLTSYASPFLINKPQIVHSVIDARREHLYYQKIVKTVEYDLELSEEKILKITDIEMNIKRGDIVTGTGLHRINYLHKTADTWIDEENISAKNLIIAWEDTALRRLFKERSVELFEPEYLTMSQLNNQ